MMHPQTAHVVREVFSSIAGRYDCTNRVLSCGLDFFWRKHVAKMVRQWNAKHILDLATGSGSLAKVLQKTCPSAKVIGMDFCRPMLLQAKRKGVHTLIYGDGTSMPFHSAAFDIITIAFGIRNIANYSKVVREIARVLSYRGGLFILDFSLPKVPWIRMLYRIYLHRLLPRIAAWITGHRQAYEYLGASIEQFSIDQSLLCILEEHGFRKIKIQTLCLGVVTLYVGQRDWSFPSIANSRPAALGT